MNNKTVLKKYIKITLIISVVFIIFFLCLNKYEQEKYRNNYNNKIVSIVSLIKEKYPNIDETEIIKILNNKGTKKTELFKKYGIDINKESIILENDKLNERSIVINLIFIVSLIVALVITFLLYIKEKDKLINDITDTIVRINNKNYDLKIDTMSEDELSILKSEIYKTTIFLKEAADNSLKDKISLKRSLEDISHQIKTPLTSILIMLDNLIEDKNMDSKTREEFTKEIRRNIVNINYLIKSLLKLSKLDSNTIEFKKEKINLNSVVSDAIKNVESLSDLHDVKVEFKKNEDVFIFNDYRWQVEALTNIIKNSIENSPEGSKVLIKIQKNNIYTELDIIDNGRGIDSKDLPHIFERFYKGKNSSEESIGIGLALAKSIIEENGDKIIVESNEKGTTFTIKYFR